jgi:glycerophosphoryl diester phosphodiesterase
MPQAIAHRGYKAAHPENTMGAFQGAVKVGAHAIETDIHITKDSVIVLSHVSTLALVACVSLQAVSHIF